MDRSDKHIWFPAKRIGWGWGLPCAWQGWVVLTLYVALAAAGVRFFPPASDTLRYVVYITLLTTLFMAICWMKGEPPRWRWPSDSK